MVVSLLAISLHTPWAVGDITSARGGLQHVDNSKAPWVQVIIAIFDHLHDNRAVRIFIDESMWWFRGEPKFKALATFTQLELRLEESIWLLNTLSDLCSHEVGCDMHPFSVGVCLAILPYQSRKWTARNPPDIGLLETVITLVTISKSYSVVYKMEIRNSSRQHPWLLPNLRNPECISNLIGDPPSTCNTELIALLFLVLYALMLQRSNVLVARYFRIITAKGDFALYTSALTAVAPLMSEGGLSLLDGCW